MSLATLIEGHASSVFLNTDHFAVTASHRPKGVAASAVNRTVWFEEIEPREMNDRGLGTERRARLAVATSVTVTSQDTWQINSELWSVVTIRKNTGGLIEMTLKLVGDELRTGRSPRIL